MHRLRAMRLPLSKTEPAERRAHISPTRLSRGARRPSRRAAPRKPTPRRPTLRKSAELRGLPLRRDGDLCHLRLRRADPCLLLPGGPCRHRRHPGGRRRRRGPARRRPWPLVLRRHRPWWAGRRCRRPCRGPARSRRPQGLRFRHRLRVRLGVLPSRLRRPRKRARRWAEGRDPSAAETKPARMRLVGFHPRRSTERERVVAGSVPDRQPRQHRHTKGLEPLS